MSKKAFNDNSSLPLISASHSYTIEPVYPKDCDVMREMTTLGSLMNDIRRWILKETGCLPSITVSQPDPHQSREVIDIHCTPAFIRKLDAEFQGRIEKIMRLPTYEEAKAKDPDMCWKPPQL
jgi:hypothetical protein